MGHDLERRLRAEYRRCLNWAYPSVCLSIAANLFGSRWFALAFAGLTLAFVGLAGANAAMYRRVSGQWPFGRTD